MEDFMMEENLELTFWGHLDMLRGTLIRIITVALICGITAFIFKEELFSIVLTPKDSQFMVYRLLGVEPFSIQLVNIGFTEQFMIRMKTVFCFEVLCASPYILYMLYKFVAPALYQRKQHYTLEIVGGGYVVFIIGILVNYYLVLPPTVRFLSTYQVSDEVQTMLSLQPYMDTMLMVNLVFGIVFEVPVISWPLAIFGLLRTEWVSKYRQHAIVTILILAAIITPTADVFALLIVSLLVWILYEMGIVIVRMTNLGGSKQLEEAIPSTEEEDND